MLFQNNITKLDRIKGFALVLQSNFSKCENTAFQQVKDKSYSREIVKIVFCATQIFCLYKGAQYIDKGQYLKAACYVLCSAAFELEKDRINTLWKNQNFSKTDKDDRVKGFALVLQSNFLKFENTAFQQVKDKSYSKEIVKIVFCATQIFCLYKGVRYINKGQYLKAACYVLCSAALELEKDRMNTLWENQHSSKAKPQKRRVNKNLDCQPRALDAFTGQLGSAEGVGSSCARKRDIVPGQDMVDIALRPMAGNPQKVEAFSDNLFRLDVEQYGDDITQVMGLLDSLKQTDGRAFLESIMKNPSQIALFSRLLQAVESLEAPILSSNHSRENRDLGRQLEGASGTGQPSARKRDPVPVQDLVSGAREEFSGVFRQSSSRACDVLTENLELIRKKYPYMLKIHGDNDCLYKALATMQYIREQSTANLADYQLAFAREARGRVAHFLRVPENIQHIPGEIVAGSFPNQEELREFIAQGILSEQDARDTYGGTNTEEILQTIATPGKRPSSNLEIYVLSLLYGEFFDLSFKCSLASKDPSVKSTTYPYPGGDTRSADLPLDASRLPWDTHRSEFSDIGFPLQFVAGHYHVALTENAARFLNRDV
jgi:hypothetical protein